MLITQDSGRKLRLDELHQHETYGGLIVGNPTDVMNDMTIEEARERAAKLLYDSHPAYVVPPVRTPLELHPESERRRRIPGKPERLPFITCIAQFKSAVRKSSDVDSDADGSALTVIWFQDDFALPVDPAIEADLRVLDWDRLAWDWGF